MEFCDLISNWDLPFPASSLPRVVREVNDCLICWDFLLCFCLVFLVYLFSVFPTKAYVPRLRLRLRPADGWKFIFAVKPVNVIIDRHLCDEAISHLPVCLPVIRVFFLAFKERQANLAATNPSYNGNDVVSWNFSFLLKLNEARVFTVRSIFVAYYLAITYSLQCAH